MTRKPELLGAKGKRVLEIMGKSQRLQFGVKPIGLWKKENPVLFIFYEYAGIVEDSQPLPN